MLTPLTVLDPIQPLTLAWPVWGRAMKRATRSHCAGHGVAAVAHGQTALMLADQGVRLQASAPDGLHAGTALSALVHTQVCLSDWLAEEGQLDSAIQGLARVHGVVLCWLVQHGAHDPRHTCATACIRHTHAALLALWVEYGPNPCIEGAIRAGCLRMCPPPALH